MALLRQKKIRKFLIWSFIIRSLQSRHGWQERGFWSHIPPICWHASSCVQQSRLVRTVDDEKGPGRTTVPQKIRQPKNSSKSWNRNRKSRKMWHSFWVALPKYINWSNKHSWSDFISGAYCAVISMNPNQAFCFAFASLLLQIIDMQQQQMFTFFILYQRWVIHVNPECRFIRRRRQVRRIRVAPYTWTIPRPAESWFKIHYLSPLLFLRSFVALLFFLFLPNLQLTWSWSGYRSHIPQLLDYGTD